MLIGEHDLTEPPAVKGLPLEIVDQFEYVGRTLLKNADHIKVV